MNTNIKLQIFDKQKHIPKCYRHLFKRLITISDKNKRYRFFFLSKYHFLLFLRRYCFNYLKHFFLKQFVVDSIFETSLNKSNQKMMTYNRNTTLRRSAFRCSLMNKQSYFYLNSIKTVCTNKHFNW